uniref:ATP-binding protein n=1 Tax=Candidatus Cryptobacteroides bacterium TaxID=3085639 RepID=UPI004029A57A
MTVDNIFTTRFARNPLISRVLTEMELVRELNEGVPRIFEEMKAAGLPEPKIVETTTNVTVVLYNGKTAANNAQTTEKTTEKIIRILKERPYATAGQLAEELGLTIDGVDYNIRKLKKQGRIVGIGGDKGGHWEINEK